METSWGPLFALRWPCALLLAEAQIPLVQESVMIEDTPELGIRLIANLRISYPAMLVERLEGSGRGLGGGTVTSGQCRCHLVAATTDKKISPRQTAEKSGVLAIPEWNSTVEARFEIQRQGLFA